MDESNWPGLDGAMIEEAPQVAGKRLYRSITLLAVPRQGSENDRLQIAAKGAVNLRWRRRILLDDRLRQLVMATGFIIVGEDARQ